MPMRPYLSRIARRAGLPALLFLATASTALAEDDFGPGSWRIVSVAAMELPASEAKIPSFEVGADARSFSATLGCNSFGGSIASSGGTLTLSEVVSTQMGCPPPLDMFEAAFAEALGKVRGRVEDGGMVTLAGEDGEALVILVDPAGG